VRASAGNHEFKLRAGDAVIFSAMSTFNSRELPLAGIAVRNNSIHQLENDAQAYLCEFSLPSALYQLSQLNSLRKSAAIQDRSLFAKIAKNAAAIQTITASRGAYRPTN
jgi:hypothetical protein